jgi:hypothetical protein
MQLPENRRPFDWIFTGFAGRENDMSFYTKNNEKRSRDKKSQSH